MSRDYISKGALISPCGTYRYRLWREWRGTHSPNNWRWMEANSGAGQRLGEPKACLFIMLNPSTADGEQDDATIRRCVEFAAARRYERLEVVNLFAYRATRPADILSLPLDEAVGPDNLEHVRVALLRAGLVICAWGNDGCYLGQDETMLGWLDGKKVYALGVTLDGHPRHPLYLRSDAVLKRFHGSKRRDR